MFIELVEALRCPADHADSWLVASIASRDGRFIVEGTLGCPICFREYPIVAGVARFVDDRADHDVTRSIEAVRDTDRGSAAGPDEAIRIAAFLALGDGQTIAIAGDWARTAVQLSQLLSVRVYALNPVGAIEQGEAVGVIQSDQGLPFGPRSLSGVALDARTASERDVASAVRALVPGGRLVAPVTASVPAEVVVLARDSALWVAEKTRELVRLGRR